MKLVNRTAERRLFWRGSIVSVAGMLAMGVMNYLVRRQLALELEPAAFGFFYSMLALFALAGGLSECGTSAAGALFIARELESGENTQARTHFTLTLYISLLRSIILAAFFGLTAHFWLTGFFGYPAGSTAYWLTMLYLIPMPISATLVGTVAAVRNFAGHNVLLNLRGGTVLLGILLFLQDYDLSAAALAFAAGEWLSGLGALLYLRRFCRFYHPNLTRPVVVRETRQLFRTGLWLYGQSLWLASIFPLTTLCLTRLTSLETTAIYNIALPLLQIGQSFLMILPQTFAPIAAGLWQERKIAEIAAQIRTLGLLLLSLMLPVTVATWFLAPWAIRLLFDVQYLAAAKPLTIMVPGVFLLAIAQMELAVLQAAGREKNASLRLLPLALLSVALTIALTAWAGINGAAWAGTITFAGLVLVLLPPTVKLLREIQE